MKRPILVKKNVLLRPLYSLGMIIGPPKVPPNSCCFSRETVGAKKPRASKASLRTYSDNDPCHSLVPDLVTNEMVLPPVKPYSAEALLTTLNSANVSAG